VGRKLLSENAERKTEKIQRLRQDKRSMRASARGDDRGKESGDRKRKGEDGKGVNEERADRWSALNIWYVVDKEIRTTKILCPQKRRKNRCAL